MKTLILILLLLGAMGANAQQLKRVHYRYSQGRTVQSYNVPNGKQEIKQWGNFDLTVNTDFVSGKMKAQKVNWGKKWSVKATFISTETKKDSIVIDSVLTSSLVCDKIAAIPSNIIPSNIITSTPNWSSLPNSIYCLRLHFDGGKVFNLNWSPDTINAAPSTLTVAQKKQVFDSVVFYYSAFGVNVTTDINQYNLATRREAIYITPSSSWYGGYGGVAYTGIFKEGKAVSEAYMPSWAFENNLAYTVKYIADAVTHELGHGLGLGHQPTMDVNCNITSGYNNGNATSGPWMGDPYQSKFGQFDSSKVQDDLKLLLQNGFSYRNPTAGRILQISNNSFIDSGFLVGNGDSVIFSCTNQISSFKLNSGQFKGTLISGGIKVQGNPNAAFIDNCYTTNRKYGRIGKFIISGTVSGSQPPPCGSPSNPNPVISISPSNNIQLCNGQTLNLSATGAQTYSWSPTSLFTQPSMSSQTVKPLQSTTFTVIGSASTQCTSSFMGIIQVLPIPQILINASQNNPVCKQSIITLTANSSPQASSFLWTPATLVNSTKQTATFSPTGSSIISVIGTDANGCTGSASYQVVVTDCNTSTCQAPVFSYVSSSNRDYLFSWTSSGVNVKYSLYRQSPTETQWHFLSTYQRLNTSYPKTFAPLGYKFKIIPNCDATKESNMITIK